MDRATNAYIRGRFKVLAKLTALLAEEYEQCADCSTFEDEPRTCQEIVGNMEAVSAMLDRCGVDHGWLLPEIQEMRAAWPKP